MKKSRILHLGLLTLVLALLTFSLVSGTLAKYVTTLDATGTVTVAKWAVLLNGDAETAKTTFSVAHTDANTAAAKVAPGTEGQFNLKYTTAGTEVKHKVEIALAAATLAADLPQLKFYSDAARTTQITLGATAFYTTEHPVNGVAEQTVTVYWAWPFVGNDAADTADGVAAQTYPMTATLTVTQVD